MELPVRGNCTFFFSSFVPSCYDLFPHAVFRNDIGPGPAHGLDPSITRTGKDGTPHYSLYSRRKELEPFKTPGPGAYAPEQHSNPYSARAPTYTMGVRTRYRKRMCFVYCQFVQHMDVSNTHKDILI